MEPETEIIEEDRDMADFRKINIFGEEGVGKTSFISCLENYGNKNFKIIPRDERETLKSYDDSKKLVENVKRVKVPINKNEDMHFLIYETRLNNWFDIKKNFGALLYKTECVLIMWDKGNLGSLNNLVKLLEEITDRIRALQLRYIDIYIVQNKSDLEINDEDKVEMEKVEKAFKDLKDLYKDYNLHEVNISLTKKEGLDDLLSNITKGLKEYDEEFDAKNEIKFKYPIQLIENIENKETINICLVGTVGSGKKTFLNSLLDGENNDINIIKEGKNRNCLLAASKGSKKLVKILVTSDLLNNFHKNCHTFLLILDVTDKDSIEIGEHAIKTIEKRGGKSIVVLGNKIDDIEGRKVSEKSLQDLSKKFGYYKYIECSSLYKVNVLEAFRDLVFLGNIQNNIIKNQLKEENQLNQDTIQLNAKNQNAKEKKRKCDCWCCK